MLQCPLCATRYADGTTACPLDGSALLPVPTPGEYGPRWSADSRAAALSVSSRGSATLGPGAAGSGPEAVTAADPLLGQILGAKLRVLRRIGQGGMGTVYVAEHLALGKPVAVKVLSTQYAEHGTMADLVHRLHTEARHTAAIKNEHIVDIFDIGTTEDGRPYVEMELLTGESLAQRLARCSALSEADTLRLGRQLASALSAAHKSGIVHRDIKPENIFLCDPAAYGKDPRDGDFVKVLDFGISKAVRALELGELPKDNSAHNGDAASAPKPRAARETRDPRLTRTGAILGTPLYMSPEQVRGELLDHRVDVYAVGVVLYECLTGSVPHGACNYLAVVAKILTEVPEPPSQRSPERSISPELEHIVLRAMAADPGERYATMEAVLEDLRRYAAGQELLPPPRAGSAGTPGVSGGSGIYGAATSLHAGAAPSGASGLGDSGGALGHLWGPILLGMVLVLGLGGGVAAVLRPRGPWSFAANAPMVGPVARADGPTARPAPSSAAVDDARSRAAAVTGTPEPGLPGLNDGRAVRPAAPGAAAADLRREAADGEGPPGPGSQDGRTMEQAAPGTPAVDPRRRATDIAGPAERAGKSAAATAPAALRTDPAALPAGGGDAQLPHRLVHPRLPATPGAHRAAQSSPGDALLLDEQAPNPFVAPSSPGRTDKPPTPPPTAPPTPDDSRANPR